MQSVFFNSSAIQLKTDFIDCPSSDLLSSIELHYILYSFQGLSPLSTIALSLSNKTLSHELEGKISTYYPKMGIDVHSTLPLNDIDGYDCIIADQAIDHTIATVKAGCLLFNFDNTATDQSAIQVSEQLSFDRMPSHKASYADITIHAVLPVHNRLSLTLQSLEGLKTQQGNLKISITVIDDGSTDGTAETLKASFPDVTVIQGSGKLYWTGATAKAVAESRLAFKEGDFVLLINNDAVLQPNTLLRLLQKAVMDRGLIWSPLAYENGQPIATAEAGHTLYHHHLQTAAALRFPQGIPAKASFGRCTLYPAEIFLEDNFDPETFPHYYGDTDFGLRMAAKGYQAMVDPSHSITVIQEAGTTGSHYQFFAKKRNGSQIWEALFGIRSLYNVRYYWRYLKRHEPDQRFQKWLKNFWNILKNYSIKA